MNPLPSPTTPAAGQLSVPWERVDHFIGQFTHDLRNGLNALELQLTLLGESAQDPVFAEDIRTMRSTLANLGRDMQAVRLAAGPIRASLLSYPASDLVEDLRERQEKRAAGVICWQLAPEAQLAGLTLEIDPELLIASLLLLLENAVRFRAKPDAVLTFAAEAAMLPAHPVGLRLSLTEEKAGPLPAGVALETWGQTPLFTTRHGGYGLGLFRARRAIEAQGGTLQAEWSSSPPHQLRTTVWLPASLPAPVKPAPPVRQPPTTLRV